MLDAIRFKKLLLQLLKVLVIIELVSAFADGVRSGSWGRFGVDLIIAGVLYVAWERIRQLLRTKREEYRRRMETASDRVKLWEALVFSLLWTDEIYEGIPPDRRRIVIISYTLIALGLLAAFVRIGTGLMPLIISGALVLGAVNLVSWVVSRERVGRESAETELRIAHEVQASLMPAHHPTVEGFDIAGISLPAREVGGDHFDYAVTDGAFSKLGISVFDVSGKGMQAAMAAVFTSGAFSAEIAGSESPANVVTRLNRAVSAHMKRGHFVSFLFAALDPAAKTVTFANAGEVKPLLLRGSGVEWLDASGVHFPLGMKEDTVYEERTVGLQSGDVLVLLTDGFPEAMNSSREQFGADRLEAFLRDAGVAHADARAMLDGCVSAVRGFAGDAPQHDDMTMVVVRVL